MESRSHTFSHITSFVISALIASVFAFVATPVISLASNSGDISCWISASPRYIEEGESTRLSWGSNGARDGYITDLGSVSSSGSRSISDIDETTTFTLTVENDGWEDECSVTVYVDEYSADSRDLSCSIELDYLDSSYSSYRAAMLRWNSDGAESARIDGIGAVALNGAQVVYPDRNSDYTMTVRDGSDHETCSTADVDRTTNYVDYHDYNYMNNTNYHSGYTSQQYIHLTQIPYTGYGLGPVAEGALWLSIIIFAFAGATYIAHRRKFLALAIKISR